MHVKQTLSTYLDRADGRPSGFDYMRIMLSVCVVLVHAILLTNGHRFERENLYEVRILGPLVMLILPMFFALSGFLVAGSLRRCRTLISFLGFRVSRIYPALVAEVLLTALLVAPFVVSKSPSEYFGSPEFFRYLWNVTGHTTPYLQGSFATNPVPGLANVQLWTVPYELLCYIALSGVALLGGGSDRRIALFGATVATVAVILWDGVANDWVMPAAWGTPFAGRFLVLAFLYGVCAYFYRDVIRVSGASACLALVVVVLACPNGYFGELIGLGAGVYLMAALGVMNPPRIALLKHADLSYGIFLYHGIVQQVIIFSLPEVPSWQACFALSLALSAAVAYLSWTLVERPVLAKKYVWVRLEDGLIGMRDRLTARARVAAHREPTKRAPNRA